jgi:AraC family transcriptional regulator
MLGEGKSYQYLAGVAVNDTKDLPEGFSTVVIPERTYAVFTHQGRAADTPRTMRAILGEHLPRMGLKPQGEPGMVESYDERFDPRTGRGEIEIWIAVRA